MRSSANTITILGGAGCAGAHTELMALAGKLNAPIVHALRGKEFIEYDLATTYKVSAQAMAVRLSHLGYFHI